MANWSKLFVAFGRCLNRSRAIKNSAFLRHTCIFGSVIVAGGLVYQHFGPLPMSRPYIVLADEVKVCSSFMAIFSCLCYSKFLFFALFKGLIFTKCHLLRVYALPYRI